MKLEVGSVATPSAGYNTPGCASTGPAGRQWLLGWYTEGVAQNPTPTSFLGFTPDGGDFDFPAENFGAQGGFACVDTLSANGNPTALMVAIDPGAPGAAGFGTAVESGVERYDLAAAGNFDNDWDTIIANVKSGLNLNGLGNYVQYVRIDPEFNLVGAGGSNLAINGGPFTPAQFVSAWNRCAAKWKAAGFKTCWNPSTTQAGDTRGAVSAYFPGSTNCDLVGLDTYTLTGASQTSASLIGPADGSGVGTLNWYKTQNFGNLPICFPEWGDNFCLHNADGTQITAMINWMNSMGTKFVHAAWWNDNSIAGVGTGAGTVGQVAMAAGITNNYGGTYWPLPLITTKNFPNYKP